MITRYDLEETGNGFDSFRDMVERGDGDWLRWEDHERAVAVLKAAITAGDSTLGALSACNERLEAENAALKAELTAMTIDRNLWQDAHNEDCPNAPPPEAL